MTAQEQQDIRTIVEAFWQYDSGWGSAEEEREAARRLQVAAGYRTELDHWRGVRFPASEAIIATQQPGKSV